MVIIIRSSVRGSRIVAIAYYNIIYTYYNCGVRTKKMYSSDNPVVKITRWRHTPFFPIPAFRFRAQRLGHSEPRIIIILKYTSEPVCTVCLLFVKSVYRFRTNRANSVVFPFFERGDIYFIVKVCRGPLPRGAQFQWKKLWRQVPYFLDLSHTLIWL